MEFWIERGQLVEEGAAALQPSHKEGRERRVQQDALVQRLAECQPKEMQQRRCTATFTARLLTYGLEKKDSASVAVHRTGCQGSFSCYLLEEGYMRGGATKSHPPHPHEAQE